jgi:hypothetical protein
MTPEETLIQRVRHNPRWAVEEMKRLQAELDKTQHDLDQAVGYKIAVAALPRGEWDREDIM